MKIKISKLDKLFSEYIRKRAKGICEYGGERRESLQCHHYFGRRKKSVRFDPDNCIAICFYHHQYLHENPHYHREWWKKHLGEKKYKELVLRENLTNKIDLKAIELWLKHENKTN